MSLHLDAMDFCKFKSAKENYKVSLNYMLQHQINLEQEEQHLTHLITTKELPIDTTQRFEKFRTFTEDASTKWSYFKANEIPPYYLAKHQDIILRTDAAFRSLFDSSKDLLQKANEKKNASFQHYREMNKKGSDHLNAETIANLEPKAENR